MVNSSASLLSRSLATGFVQFTAVHKQCKLSFNRSITSAMSPSLTSQPFELPSMHNLSIGRALAPFTTGYEGPTMNKKTGWSLPAGVYIPSQIVESCAPLLEIVLHHLRPDPANGPTARHMLLDNLASNLALETRESSLNIPLRDAGRKEIADQATKIGETLVGYAREVKNAPFDPDYVIRSPCEGHLLKPPVTQLMFGPRSLGHLMQIYNEYLHQMVLLRDALLPFENYEEVIIPVVPTSGRGRLGTRSTEKQRMSFIAELMTKSITQASVFKVAQSLLAPALSSDNAYGFQYTYGLVLPAAVVGSTSLRLLRYIPAVIDETTPEISFENQFADYYTSPRAEVSSPVATVEKGDLPSIFAFSLEDGLGRYSFEIAPESLSEKSRLLQLHLEHSNGICSSVDVGQIARGWRYAYRVGYLIGTAAVEHFSAPCSVHLAEHVLAGSGESGLVTAKAGGIHLIQAQNRVEILALLGRLYPDNIIVLEEGGSLKDVEEAGQALPDEPRFVLQLVDKKGGA